jgi:chromosome segregation ATPase
MIDIQTTITNLEKDKQTLLGNKQLIIKDIKDLNEELSGQRTIISKFEQTKRQIELLTEKINASQRTEQNLLTKIQSANDEIEIYTSNLKRHNGELTNLKTQEEKELKKKIIQSFEKDIRTATGNLNTLNTEINKNKNTLEQASRELEALNSTNLDVEKYNESSKKRNELVKQIEVKTNDNTNNDKTIEKINRQILHAKMLLLEKYERNEKKLNSTLQELEQTISKQNEFIIDLENAKNNVHSKDKTGKDLEHQLFNTQNKLRELQQYNTQTQQSLTNQIESLKTLQTTTIDLETAQILYKDISYFRNKSTFHFYLMLFFAISFSLILLFVFYVYINYNHTLDVQNQNNTDTDSENITLESLVCLISVLIIIVAIILLIIYQRRISSYIKKSDIS